MEETLTEKYIIQEEDLEVADLNLTDSQFQILEGVGKKYFFQDTFNLLASNYEVCTNMKDIYFLFIRILMTLTGYFITHYSFLNLVSCRLTL